MDKAKREELIRKFKAQNLLEPQGRWTPLPVVSLEDFFDGNDDYGSIGCNLLEREHPGPKGFYAVLKEIRDCRDVQDILVEIYEIEEQEWPYSERLYILATAQLDTVTEWMKPLSPSEVSEGHPWSRMPLALPELQPGVTLFTAWWD